MHHEALTKVGAKLFPGLKQFSDFYLAGGTALALQIGHRLSVDFDLFGGADIEKDLLQKVEKVFPESAISPLVNNSDELSVLVDEVKVTFLKYPFPVLNAFTDLNGLRLLDVLEIAVTKAYTIGRRGSFKDYVDMYFILSGKYSSLEQVMQIAEKKFGGEFNSRLFLEQLIYLEDIEEAEIIFLKEKVGKEQIRNYFIEQARIINL